MPQHSLTAQEPVDCWQDMQTVALATVTMSFCKSKSSWIAEIHEAQGTLLFCPYYPFKSPSNSFGNAIHLHKAHAFERERRPFWEGFYFASTVVVEAK